MSPLGPSERADRDPPELHATFRPRRGRRMAIWVGIAQGIGFVLLTIIIPTGALGFGWADRIGILAVGAAIGLLLWRFARLAAFVGDSGLRVRNLAGDRLLDWAQVVNVRFGGGQPWVTLDLADGETLAVMAIQRADGEFGESEARRLATLVTLHSATESND